MGKAEDMNTDGCIALIGYIIRDAAKEYKYALRTNNCGLQQECENFFESEYFYGLTSLDGTALIEKIRKEFEEEENEKRRHQKRSYSGSGFPGGV